MHQSHPLFSWVYFSISYFSTCILVYLHLHRNISGYSYLYVFMVPPFNFVNFQTLCRWIKHHYFATAMALISLTWEIERGPDCAQRQVRKHYLISINLYLIKEEFFAYFTWCGLLYGILYSIFLVSLSYDWDKKLSLQKGVELFLKWAIMQGVAMILQNRYQRQRLYTRIALGKVRKLSFLM